MSKKIKYLNIILCCFTFQSCVTGWHDAEVEKLTYYKNSNYKNQFRIDGYYYDPSYSYIKDNRRWGWIFWKDGTFYQARFFYSDSENDSINRYNAIDTNNKMTPFFWGAFYANDDTLRIQYYDSRIMNGGRFFVCEYVCHVINDTTIRITKYIDAHRNKQGADSTIYHFKHLDWKPDSIDVVKGYPER